MPTAGIYYAVGQWDDIPDSNYPSRNDSPAYATLTVRLWSTETTYHQPPNILPGDIQYNGQSLSGGHLWRQFTTPGSVYSYLTGINLTYGTDSDERWITTVYNCQDTVSKDTVADNCGDYWQDYSVYTPGVYTATGIWNDGGTPNYYDDGTTPQSFTLHLWIPQTTYIVEPLMQRGHIYQQGNIIDNQTFYEPVHPEAEGYTLTDWIGRDNQIWASNGSDYDTRLITTYQENGQISVSTSSCSNNVTIVPPSDYVTFSQPGIYSIVWTYVDSSTGAEYFVDDPEVSRSITLIVFKVEITQPTTWPQSVAINNTIPLTATVTPPEALADPPDSSYYWSYDSGGQYCYGVFTAMISETVNTTVFYAGSCPGDCYIHVIYQKAGKAAHSEPRKIVMFGMNILEVGFTGDNTIQCNTTLIVDPVWSTDTEPNKNDPVCYIKNNSLTMTGKFALSTTLPSAATVYIKADDSGSDNLDALKTASISQMTTPIFGITTNGTLPNYVCITSANYTWKFSTDSINWPLAASPAWPAEANTGPHKIYITLSTPQAPMDTTWTEVLDRSCSWADGATTEFSVASSITQAIYNMGAYYDGGEHFTRENYTNFYLKALLNSYFPGVEMDCRDFANLTHVMTNSLGLSAQYLKVGGALSNRYGFDAHWFWTNDILPASHPSWETTEWTYHQVGWWNSKVCDASLKLDNDSDPQSDPHEEKISLGDMSLTEYGDKLTEDTPFDSWDDPGICTIFTDP